MSYPEIEAIEIINDPRAENRGKYLLRAWFGDSIESVELAQKRGIFSSKKSAGEALSEYKAQHRAMRESEELPIAAWMR